jgi:hypothetical protein
VLPGHVNWFDEGRGAGPSVVIGQPIFAWIQFDALLIVRG